MRKYSYLLLLGFLSLSLTLFYACQKDSNNVLAPVQSLVAPPITTSSSSVDPLEEENCDKMVHTAALGILNLSKDPQFRDLVHQHCLAMFDDDYNVLLKDLKTPLLTQTGIDLTNSFDNSIRANLPTINSIVAHVPYGHFTDFDNIRKSIDGFDYYSGREYLQIYVPNFESATSELPNTVANEQPIILIYPEEVDDTTPAYGYVLQDDGTFKVTMITQSFLDSHLIWVISINETVDDDGNCPVQSKSVVTTGGAENALKANARVATEKKRIKFEKWSISAKKESGWSGRADVEISFGHFYECFNSDRTSTYGPLYNYSNSINAGQGLLKKVSRYKLNCWFTDLPDLFKYLADYPTGGGNVAYTNYYSALEEYERFAIVIYEADARAKFDKEFFPCGTGSLSFTSKQDPYLEKFYLYHEMPPYNNTFDVWDDHQDNNIIGNEGLFNLRGMKHVF